MGQEFALYRAIGIDTVILIRAGYRDRCVFPSRTVPNLRPVYDDLAEMFLGLSEENGIQLFFGLYDSGLGWESGIGSTISNSTSPSSTRSRKGMADGRALPGGISSRNEPLQRDRRATDQHAQPGVQTRPRPPRVGVSVSHGVKQFGAGAHPLDMARREWERLFAETEGSIDICAFQDGQLDYSSFRHSSS